MAKTTNHSSKCKKVYECEQAFKDEGCFVFRRTSPHGLFHVIAIDKWEVKLVQVLRVKKFNFSDVNNELVKIQDFVLAGNYPVKADVVECELWVWVNNKGWVKYFFDKLGRFHKFEDYGTNDFRKKKDKKNA
jgi:hypothetical protein